MAAGLVGLVTYFAHRAHAYALPDDTLQWYLSFFRPRHPPVHPDGQRFERATILTATLAIVWVLAWVVRQLQGAG